MLKEQVDSGSMQQQLYSHYHKSIIMASNSYQDYAKVQEATTSWSVGVTQRSRLTHQNWQPMVTKKENQGGSTHQDSHSRVKHTKLKDNTFVYGQSRTKKWMTAPQQYMNHNRTVQMSSWGLRMKGWLSLASAPEPEKVSDAVYAEVGTFKKKDAWGFMLHTNGITQGGYCTG